MAGYLAVAAEEALEGLLFKVVAVLAHIGSAHPEGPRRRPRSCPGNGSVLRACRYRAHSWQFQAGSDVTADRLEDQAELASDGIDSRPNRVSHRGQWRQDGQGHIANPGD